MAKTKPKAKKPRSRKPRARKARAKRLDERDVVRVEEMNFNPNYPDVDFSNDRKVLEVALRNEIRGRNLYALYARTVKNEMARRVFVHLANEELRHISDIKEALRSMKMEMEPDVGGMIESGTLEHTRTFFGKLVGELKEQVKPSDDDKKSRQVAMAIEKAGFEYYKKGAEFTQNEEIKRFLTWLMEQEQAHYMLIENAFEYADNPESWHADMEHWILEG